MNANTKKWVKALRSGKYKQGTGRLRSMSDEYCCLGIACDVSGLDKWKYKGFYKYKEGVGALPIAVKKWLGLRDRFGSFGKGESLSAMNDNGFLFEEIADVIEEKWEELKA